MKKLNKLFSTAILGALAFGSFGQAAFAAGTGTAEDPATGTGTITFEENTNTTDPVDPLDPSQPGETDGGDNNEVTDAEGPLSLDVYPSTFDFGTQVVDLSGATYNSTLTGTHYLQVTDNRSNADGWSVSVERTEFTSADGSESLDGSKFVIPAGTARNSLNSPASAEDTNLTTAGEFDIQVGASTTVFGADGTDSVGKSTSTYAWDSSQETLTIPANTAKTGTFTSTINWVLTATPAS